MRALSAAASEIRPYSGCPFPEMSTSLASPNLPIFHSSILPSFAHKQKHASQPFDQRQRERSCDINQKETKYNEVGANVGDRFYLQAHLLCRGFNTRCEPAQLGYLL